MVIIALFIVCLLFSSCEYGPQDAFFRASNSDNRTKTYYELELSQCPAPSSDVYTVAVFSDIHFGKKQVTRREQVFLDWLVKMKENGTAPEFCICLGDIADHGYKSEFEDYVEFTQQVEQILGTGRVYNVLGNHDLYNDGWNHYSKLVFPYKSLYGFKTKTFSWYCIDSASGTLGSKQYKKIKELFENDPAPKIVMTHIPAYSNPMNNMGYFTFQNTYEADMLLSLYAKNNVRLVLNGHIHKAYKNYFNNCLELTVPSITEQNRWTVITVDETNGTIKEEVVHGK